MSSIKKATNAGFFIVILVIVFYIGFLIYSDVESLGEVFFNINLFFIPLILLIRFSAIILRSVRQKLFLNSLGFKISFKNNLLIYVAGLSMAATPGGSGSLIKSYILNKKFGFPYSKTTPIVITEKYHDMLAPLSIIAVMLIFIDFIVEVKIVILILSIVMTGIFVFARNRKLLEKTLGKISKIKLLKKYQDNIINIQDSFFSLSGKSIMLKGWSIGAASILVDGLAIYLGFLSLGLDFGFFNSFAVTFTANIIGMASFIPGGFGVTEAGMAGLLVQYGLELSLASAVVLLTRLTGIFFSIFMGLIAKLIILRKS